MYKLYILDFLAERRIYSTLNTHQFVKRPSYVHTQVVSLPLHFVPLRFIVGVVLGGLTSQLEVVEAFKGNGARADVIPLVTELSHSLDDATVYAKYVAHAVGEGYLIRDV